MAEFFRQDSDFKSTVGGAVNTSFSLKSIEKAIYDAGRKYLVPWLGQAFYDECVAQYEKSQPDAKYVLLFPYIQSPLAYLALFEYSSIGVVQFSDTGIYRVESDHHKSAYKYQEGEYKKQVREYGYNGIEYLLLYLKSKEDDFTTWKDSDEAIRHTELLVSTSTQLRNAYDLMTGRFTYETLRPFLEGVEQFAIKSTLPNQFFTRLKAGISDDDLTAEEKTVLKYIRTAICNMAVTEAVNQNQVLIEGNSIVTKESSVESALNNLVSANWQDRYLQSSAKDIWANRYLSLAERYMKDNVSKFKTAFDVDSGGTNTDADAWSTAVADDPVISKPNPEDFYEPGGVNYTKKVLHL